MHKFSKNVSDLKILGVRRVRESKFHIEDPQILGTTVKNLVMVTWHLEFVHHCKYQ
jgi:hypothetical protein